MQAEALQGSDLPSEDLRAEDLLPSLDLRAEDLCAGFDLRAEDVLPEEGPRSDLPSEELLPEHLRTEDLCSGRLRSGLCSGHL